MLQTELGFVVLPCSMLLGMVLLNGVGPNRGSVAKSIGEKSTGEIDRVARASWGDVRSC